MIEFIRDPAWQFAGVLLALVAIAVAVVIYYRQTQRKELAFGSLSVRSLLTVSEELANRVVVSFDGERVENIQLLVLGIKNSGDKPILAADFERVFSVGFGLGSRVLSADVTKQFPSDLAASIRTIENRVQLSPLLLNPGDYVVVKVLLSADKLDVVSDCRIVGISRPVPLNEGLRLRPGAIRSLGLKILLFGGIGVGIIFLDYFGVLKSPAPRPPRPASPWTDAAYVGGVVLIFMLVLLRDWIVGRVRNNARRYIDDA